MQDACVRRRKGSLVDSRCFASRLSLSLYKERFKPTVLTKRTNIADSVGAEPGRTSDRRRVYVFDNKQYLLHFSKHKICSLVFWDGVSRQQSRLTGLAIVKSK